MTLKQHHKQSSPTRSNGVPKSTNGLLRSGDRLTQVQFHALYRRMPGDFKAELLQGVVYVSSPAYRPHGRFQTRLVTLLGLYESQTPGVEAYDNTTVILSGDSESQPDAVLLLVPMDDPLREWNKGGAIRGTPELVAEVSDTTRHIDLDLKKPIYQKEEALEYLVVDVPGRKLHWFDLERDELIGPSADGVLRSRTFPGFWIDPAAFFEVSSRHALRVVRRGLASPEHKRFVKLLANRRKKKSKRSD